MTKAWIIGKIICLRKGHDWRANGPMYSDGWESKCERCGKIKQVNR